MLLPISEGPRVMVRASKVSRWRVVAAFTLRAQRCQYPFGQQVCVREHGKV